MRKKNTIDFNKNHHLNPNRNLKNNNNNNNNAIVMKTIGITLPAKIIKQKHNIDNNKKK